ncbi:MAG: hypothetical protein ACI4GO_07715 [Hominenteromicrobium sp.]
MKFFRSVLLPALLCAMILALGFFMPGLLGRVSPDFRDEPQTVSVAGAESPLYIENTVEVALPPWDIIDETRAASFSDLADFSDRAAEQVDALLTGYLEPFIPDARITPDHPFYQSLLIQNDLLFTRDFRVTTASAAYTVDVVITTDGIPLYIHTRELGTETAPASDPEVLEDDLASALGICSAYLENWMYGQPLNEMSPVWLVEEAEIVCPNTYVPVFAEVFSALFSRVDADADGYLQNELLYLWDEVLRNRQDIYSLTYENETLLVVTDDQNHLCLLFFDGTQARVTGISVDAALLGYSAAPTPLPTENNAAEN